MRFILFIIIAFSFQRCATGKIAGKYVDKEHGDTLYLKPDSTYQYLEKLNSGVIGLTEGKWSVRNREVSFKCDHKPLVGYRLRIRKETNSSDFRIRLVEDSVQKPVFIENVELFNGGHLLGGNPYLKSGNTIDILTRKVDSIVIQTFNYQNLSLTSLEPGTAYLLTVFPDERLYELDKVPFKFIRKFLKSTQSPEYDDIRLKLKRKGK
ncbi:MAG: hypothetical protein J0H55_02120 [Chitinophagaceae bacterium]|nr:hypothetical protein [Chitinophagaceae bacterium]